MQTILKNDVFTKLFPLKVETMKSSEKMNDLFPNACDKEKVDVPLPEDLVSCKGFIIWKDSFCKLYALGYI